MVSKLKKVLSEVLKRTTPSSEEKKNILALAKNLEKRVEKAARNAKVEVKVRLEGSIAKNTWLRESPDIDIFIQVPPTESREALGTLYLDIAKEAKKAPNKLNASQNILILRRN